MSDTREQGSFNLRREFPFPIFLYVVVFLVSGMLNVFHVINILYQPWWLVPIPLWGLINLYILPYANGWIGVLVSLSGVLNVLSAVLVFMRKKQALRIVYVNLAFEVLIGSMCFIKYYFVSPLEFIGYLATNDPVSFIVFLGANGFWFWYFRKNRALL